MQKVLSTSVAALMLATQVLAPAAVQAQRNSTATPIKHVVIIFGENISFDHYFGTYPYAANPRNEPRFVAAPGTPSVNGYTAGLLYNNPNLLNKAGNAGGASNPFRLDRSQAATADQDHDYTPEQQAFHGGLMDAFPQVHGDAGTTAERADDEGPGDGLLRRQHGDGAVELRAALRDERQLVQHDLWAFDAGRDQSDLRPDQWHRGSVERERRRGGRRRWRLHADQRCRPDRRCVLHHDRRAGAAIGKEHWRPVERSRRHVGLLRRRLRPDQEESQRHDRLLAFAHLRE